MPREDILDDPKYQTLLDQFKMSFYYTKSLVQWLKEMGFNEVPDTRGLRPEYIVVRPFRRSFRMTRRAEGELYAWEEEIVKKYKLFKVM